MALRNHKWTTRLHTGKTVPRKQSQVITFNYQAVKDSSEADHASWRAQKARALHVLDSLPGPRRVATCNPSRELPKLKLRSECVRDLLVVLRTRIQVRLERRVTRPDRPAVWLQAFRKALQLRCTRSEQTRTSLCQQSSVLTCTMRPHFPQKMKPLSNQELWL